MKIKFIPLLSAMLTVIALATLALFSVAESTEPKLKIAYCTLEFGQDTHILYAVTSDGVENVDDIEVYVWKTAQTDYSGKPDYTLTQAGKEKINDDNCVIFELDDLSAMNMTDSYYSLAHIKVGDKDYYSPVNKYSVLQYAYNMLGKAGKTATTDEKLKDLLNTMLDYGSKVQIYADYNTDRLANADWHYVNIEGGTLGDGFNHGLYLAKDKITVTLNEDENFSYWIDANGNELSTNGTFTVKVGDLVKNGNNNVTIKPVEPKASEGLKFTSNGDGTCYVSGIGTCKDTDVVIPKKSPAGDKVISIGSYAFNNYNSFTSITIPNGVTSIADYAFTYCYATNITIPKSVTSVGDNAFPGGLKKVYYTGNVESWLNIKMSGCSSSPFSNSFDGGDLYFGGKLLTEVVVPDTVTKIGDHAFEGCKSIKSVTISGSVKSIGYEPFRNCTNIEKHHHRKRRGKHWKQRIPLLQHFVDHYSGQCQKYWQQYI